MMNFQLFQNDWNKVLDNDSEKGHVCILMYYLQGKQFLLVPVFKKHNVNSPHSCQYNVRVQFSSVPFSSVAQSCPTLCDPMNRSPPGLPVHHQLPEFTQTHVHQVSDAIQPFHPLSSPSPPAPNPSHVRVFSNKSTVHMR